MTISLESVPRREIDAERAEARARLLAQRRQVIMQAERQRLRLLQAHRSASHLARR